MSSGPVFEPRRTRKPRLSHIHVPFDAAAAAAKRGVRIDETPLEAPKLRRLRSHTAVDFTRVNFYPEEVLTEEERVACANLLTVLNFRAKYLYRPRHGKRDEQTPLPTGRCFRMVDGVARVFSSDEEGDAAVAAAATARGSSKPADEDKIPGSLLETHSLRTFKEDYERAVVILNDGAVKSLAHSRLVRLQRLFELHVQVNGDKESNNAAHGDSMDFYSIHKCDNAVQLSGCFSATRFTAFMRHCMLEHGDEVVVDGKTLNELADAAGVDASTISIESLGVQSDASMVFQRFDRFTQRLRPAGSVDLRRAFFHINNDNGGRFLAEATKDHLRQLELSRTVHEELRVSIHGADADDWDRVAKWVVRNDLFSPVNRWMVQIPRIYHTHKASGIVSSFQDSLDNIFTPLFAVTLQPETNDDLAEFLKHVSGFDSVDDESMLDEDFDLVPPSEWTSDKNPCYAYQLYYLWANLTVLNQLRASRGLNTFSLRPHCGESGDPMVSDATTACDCREAARAYVSVPAV